MKTVDELSSAGPVPATVGISVLVVDDETAVRRFAVRVLEREGYAVIEAKDGIEALELLAKGTAAEVVVSDIIMPRLNGVELMQTLAASYPELPVILMSGYATGALAELGIAAPCAILPNLSPATGFWKKYGAALDSGIAPSSYLSAIPHQPDPPA